MTWFCLLLYIRCNGIGGCSANPNIGLMPLSGRDIFLPIYPLAEGKKVKVSVKREYADGT